MVKVLMFGWEFPPFNSGGLGTACHGLTKGLAGNGTEVIFVLPKKVDIKEDFLKIVCADAGVENCRHYIVNSPLRPYVTNETYINTIHDNHQPGMYGDTLYDEVLRYGEIAQAIALSEEFDVIHAHDWLTTKAAITAKRVSKKPLVLHIHNTVFDRGAGNANQQEYEIEREGMHAADVVVTVSQWTKNKVVEHYDIHPDKVRVVHNAIALESNTLEEVQELKKKNKKVVLFVGRITIQKGPDYFIDAAKRVIEKDPDAIFVFSGSGDMERQMIEKTARLGISDKVLFAGFLRGTDLQEAYKMADVFVMPSVSEPFGLVPLESMSYGTPVIISKQSGVSEVITHCLKTNFWDVEDMANKILSVLKYPVLRNSLSKNGSKEVKTLTWDKPAQKCVDIYKELISRS